MGLPTCYVYPKGSKEKKRAHTHPRLPPGLLSPRPCLASGVRMVGGSGVGDVKLPMEPKGLDSGRANRHEYEERSSVKRDFKDLGSKHG